MDNKEFEELRNAFVALKTKYQSGEITTEIALRCEAIIGRYIARRYATGIEIAASMLDVFEKKKDRIEAYRTSIKRLREDLESAQREAKKIVGFGICDFEEGPELIDWVLERLEKGDIDEVGCNALRELARQVVEDWEAAGGRL